MNAQEKERYEEQRFMANDRGVPRDEQRRSAWGSLLFSTQSIQGLCTVTRKCVKKDGHSGDCWPGD